MNVSLSPKSIISAFPCHLVPLSHVEYAKKFCCLKDQIPDLEVKLFGTIKDNPCKKTLPWFTKDSDAFLHQDAANALANAYRHLKAQGYFIVIYGAYHAERIQEELRTVDPHIFLSKDNNPFSKGLAVIVTLRNIEGEEVEMPSQLFDLSEKSSDSFREGSNEGYKNKKILDLAMKLFGFQSNPRLWWEYYLEGWEMGHYHSIDLYLQEIKHILGI
jgi:D-alanyl-D-alanine dipeptidase